MFQLCLSSSSNNINVSINRLMQNPFGKLCTRHILTRIFLLFSKSENCKNKNSNELCTLESRWNWLNRYTRKKSTHTTQITKNKKRNHCKPSYCFIFLKPLVRVTFASAYSIAVRYSFALFLFRSLLPISRTRAHTYSALHFICGYGNKNGLTLTNNIYTHTYTTCVRRSN